MWQCRPVGEGGQRSAGVVQSSADRKRFGESSQTLIKKKGKTRGQ